MEIKINKDAFKYEFKNFDAVAFPIFQCYKCLAPMVRNYSDDKQFLILKPNCECWTKDTIEEPFDVTKAPDLKKFEV